MRSLCLTPNLPERTKQNRSGRHRLRIPDYRNLAWSINTCISLLIFGGLELERRTENIVKRSRNKWDALVALAITAAIIILVLFVISLLVAVK